MENRKLNGVDLMPGTGQQAFQRGAGMDVILHDKQFQYHFFTH
jgi:hypothetical protein